MSKFNATIPIDKETWNEFKAICESRGTNASTEIRAFIQLTLDRDNHQLTDNPPEATRAVTDEVISQLTNYFDHRYDLLEKKFKSICYRITQLEGNGQDTDATRIEVKKLQLGNDKENQIAGAENEKQSVKRDSQNGNNSLDDRLNNQLDTTNNILSESSRKSEKFTEIKSIATNEDVKPSVDIVRDNNPNNLVDTQKGIGDTQLKLVADLKVSPKTINSWKKGRRKTPEHIGNYWFTDGKLWYRKLDN